MHVKISVSKLEAEIDDIRRKLVALGPIHPGSVSLQYQTCGNPNCRCLRKDNPERHGPYAKLTYVYRGRNVSRFVRAGCVEALSPRLAMFNEFRRLIDRWIALSIQIGQQTFFNPEQKGKSNRARPKASRPKTVRTVSL
ncbi:MAG: DUF6788 family protein [Kiritimatiellia bacterium]